MSGLYFSSDVQKERWGGGRGESCYFLALTIWGLIFIYYLIVLFMGVDTSFLPFDKEAEVEFVLGKLFTMILGICYKEAGI